MELHPDFSVWPYVVLDPVVRWFPAVRRCGKTAVKYKLNVFTFKVHIVLKKLIKTKYLESAKLNLF